LVLNDFPGKARTTKPRPARQGIHFLAGRKRRAGVWPALCAPVNPMTVCPAMLEKGKLGFFRQIAIRRQLKNCKLQSGWHELARLKISLK